jgi:hypothetical protein
LGFRVRGYHPLWPALPDRSAIPPDTTSRSRNPPVHAPGFGLFRVRSPLLTESRLISSPQGTEMFHFPWCRSEALCIQTPVSRHYPGRVAPFGHPRIIACLPLPEAFRSLPRPSSPTDAKASIVCPYTLELSRLSISHGAPRRSATRHVSHLNVRVQSVSTDRRTSS